MIIGAGAAGLMAARNLGKISFLVIEQKERIGLPLKCGEGVRKKGFIRLFGDGDYPFVENIVHKHEIRYKGVRRTFQTDYLQLDRAKFEQWLAKPIRGRIKLKTKCRDIIIKKDFAEIVTDKDKIRTRLAILAYGCNFRIQRKYGLIKKEPILFACCGGIYKNYDLDKNRFYAYFYDKYFGYLWIFPKNKDSANIGFGSIAKGVNAKKALIDLLKRINPGIKRISKYSGIVPCSGPIDKTYYDRLLVVGDSGGFVYAGTGEGIYFALESGRIGAEAAIEAIKKSRFDKEFLKCYEREWKKSFGRLMRAGMVFYDLQYLAFRKGKIRELFTIPKDEEIKDLIEGKIPFRAMVLWYFYRMLKKIF